MLVLSQAQADRGLIAVAHVDPASQDFIDLLNESTRRLMLWGNWWGTVVKATLKSYSGEIAWPRWVGTVLACNPCCHNRNIDNLWYEFMPLSGGDIDPNRSWSSAVHTVNDGEACVFQQIPTGSTNLVRAYPYQSSDFGKTITFFGIDENGNNVRSQVNGIWYDGVTIALAQPYTEMPYKMRKITRVVKDLTDGPLIVNQFDPYYGVEFEMANYEPSETVPSYRHSVIPGIACANPAQSVMRPRQLTILAKQQFIPVRMPNDVVQIDCLGAHKLMFMAIRMEESSGPAAALSLQRMGLRELNAQLRDKFPDDQTQVSILVDGTATRTLRAIGQIR